MGFKRAVSEDRAISKIACEYSEPATGNNTDILQRVERRKKEKEEEKGNHKPRLLPGTRMCVFSYVSRLQHTPAMPQPQLAKAIPFLQKVWRGGGVALTQLCLEESPREAKPLCAWIPACVCMCVYVADQTGSLQSLHPQHVFHASADVAGALIWVLQSELRALCL